ncbi:MAG: hypothetical protein Q7T44_05575 [Parvibaculum sp.]|nr:hypothetical protein [Parvibaculum sp.]
MNFRILCGAAVMAVTILNGGHGFAAEQFDPALMPHDKAALVAVSDTQMGLLRRAVRFCNDLGRSRHNNNLCVVTDLDRVVRTSGDEVLKAFHWTLAPIDRYDDKRSMVGLTKYLKK